MRSRDKSLEMFGEFESQLPSDTYLRHPSAYRNHNVWVNPDYDICQKSTDFFQNSLKGAKYVEDVIEGGIYDGGGRLEHGGRISPIVTDATGREE